MELSTANWLAENGLTNQWSRALLGNSYRNIDLNKRHILSLSAGKDSTALAVYLRDKIPNLEYVFMDTGSELREVYEYLDKIEDKLKIKVVKLNSGKSFDKWLEEHHNYLPSPHARWCTIKMKIRPYERYVGKDPAVSYMGIRADETHRKGHISMKKNLTAVYPFIEDNINLQGVYKLLMDSGLGLPKYYSWRSRSGCYFCFFQRRIEWVHLLENHPDLFAKAEAYEKSDFTWVKGKTLQYIRDNKEKIKERWAKKQAKVKAGECSSRPTEPRACNVCHL